MTASSSPLGVLINPVSNAAQAQQTQLNSTLSAMEARGAGGISQTDMLKLQQQLGLTNMFYEVQGTIVKSFMDCIKSIIQKSS